MAAGRAADGAVELALLAGGLMEGLGHRALSLCIRRVDQLSDALTAEGVTAGEGERIRAQRQADGAAEMLLECDERGGGGGGGHDQQPFNERMTRWGVCSELLVDESKESR